MNNIKKIGAELKICGSQRISTTIYNDYKYKDIQPMNKYGRAGKTFQSWINPFYNTPGITKDDLETLEEILKNDIKENKKENRKKVINRNKTMIKDLVDSNIKQWSYIDKFLTLTFRYKPDSITDADYQLKKFIKKLRYHYSKAIEYLAIRELQKENGRNAIHYHIFLFNCPYIPQSELLILWSKDNPYMDIEKPSGVNIQAIRQGLKQVINYLTGYTLKELTEEDDFLIGRKMVLKSRGLQKPKKIEYKEYENSPFSNFEIKKGLSFLESKITYIEY